MKTGAGFNRLRVLGRAHRDWRDRYDLMRRLTRLARKRRGVRLNLQTAASTVETMRRFHLDK